MYKPHSEILDKYAEIFVRFALNGGKGVKRGEVVFIEIPECAKPLLLSLQKSVLKAGAHCVINYLPDEIAREFYEHAEEHHLDFFPEHFLKGKVAQADHFLYVIAEANTRELLGIDAAKIIRKSKSFGPYKEWREKKENEGKMSWTLGLYGTEAMAKEAGMSLEEYWEQIIKACYLDKEDPIEEWRKASEEIERVRGRLNSMDVRKLHVKSENSDFIIGIDKERKWLGGGGCNIPSFEIFISPDWRKSEGYMNVDQPLYRYGQVVKGIKLEFREGRVVKCSAKEGEDILKEMIKVEGADKIGEFSLTDVRLSKIDRFMAETLFDENFGGKYGNTHIALGSAYKDSYPGDVNTVQKEQWENMGYNESAIHTDVVSTENREVTAELADGSKKIIYKDGEFRV